MKKSKILYAASTAQHLQRFHLPYIEALRADHEVFTMATGDGVDFPIPFDKHYFSSTNLRSAKQIRRILQRESFDLIILNTTLTAFWVRAALWGLKKRPYVLNVVHGYLFPLQGGGLKKQILLLCEKLMRRKTDDIAVMNQEDFQTATNYKLCRGTVYFTHGMGLSSAYAEKRVDSSIRVGFALPDELLCTYVGELSGRKNQGFLIRGIDRLRKEGIPAKLLLIGEGRERDELSRLIEERGLSDAVYLTGHRDDVPSLLAASDLYVSASVSEGLPFNLLEAMIFGLPIVASEVRGQADLLKGREESLYPLQNEDVFCERVRSFYEQKLLGRGAVSYPELERYCQQSVLEENLRIFTMGLKEE